jgi:hypothetical protein
MSKTVKYACIFLLQSVMVPTYKYIFLMYSLCFVHDTDFEVHLLQI